MSPPLKSPKSESDLAREMVVRVTLPNGQIHEGNVHDVEWIEYDNLLGEIQGQAQRYAFWAFVQVRAKQAYREAERVARRYFVKAQDGVREALTLEGAKGGAKPPTETQVKLTIEADPEYQQLQRAVERLEDLIEDVGVLREGLVQRRDMLTAAAMFRAPEASAKVSERETYRLRRT